MYTVPARPRTHAWVRPASARPPAHVRISLYFPLCAHPISYPPPQFSQILITMGKILRRMHTYACDTMMCPRVYSNVLWDGHHCRWQVSICRMVTHTCRYVISGWGDGLSSGQLRVYYIWRFVRYVWLFADNPCKYWHDTVHGSVNFLQFQFVLSCWIYRLLSSNVRFCVRGGASGGRDGGDDGKCLSALTALCNYRAAKVRVGSRRTCACYFICLVFLQGIRERAAGWRNVLSLQTPNRSKAIWWNQ